MYILFFADYFPDRFKDIEYEDSVYCCCTCIWETIIIWKLSLQPSRLSPLWYKRRLLIQERTQPLHIHLVVPVCEKSKRCIVKKILCCIETSRYWINLNIVVFGLKQNDNTFLCNKSRWLSAHHGNWCPVITTINIFINRLQKYKLILSYMNWWIWSDMELVFCHRHTCVMIPNYLNMI